MTQKKQTIPFLTFRAGETSGTPEAGTAIFRYNFSLNRVELSLNGGPYRGFAGEFDGYLYGELISSPIKQPSLDGYFAYVDNTSTEINRVSVESLVDFLALEGKAQGGATAVQFADDTDPDSFAGTQDFTYDRYLHTLNISDGDNTINIAPTSINTDADTLQLGGPSAISISGAFVLPNTDGAPNQILATDGSGTVSWQTISLDGTINGEGMPTEIAVFAGDSESGASTEIESFSDLKWLSSFSSLGIRAGNFPGASVALVIGSGQISIPNGTPAAPAIVLSNDFPRNLNSGIYAPAEGQVGVSTTGTRRLNITNSGVTFGDGSTSYTLPLTRGTTGQVLRTDGSGNVTWGSATSGTVTGTGTATRIAFWDTASSISSSGNLFWNNADSRLGLGTATPTSTLSVGPTSQFQVSSAGDIVAIRGQAYSFPPSNTTSGALTNNGSGGLSWIPSITGSGTVTQIAYFTGSSAIGSEAASGSNSLTWNSDQNLLGIGTATPTAKLHIEGGSTSSATPALRISSTSNSSGFNENNIFSVVSSSTGDSDTAVSVTISGAPGLAHGSFGISGSNTTTSALNSYFVNTGGPVGISGSSTGSSNSGIQIGTPVHGNVGVLGHARGSNVNVGTAGVASTDKNNGTNVGVAGISRNGGTGTAAAIGGLFSIIADETDADPSYSDTAALIADNHNTTSSIFLARDGGTVKFKIDDGGFVTIGESSTSYTLPIDRGADGQVLKVDGYGTVTWDSLAGVGAVTGTGTATQIAYFTGTSTVGSEPASGSNSLTWNPTSNRLGVGTSSPTYAFEVMPPPNDGANVMLFSDIPENRPLITLTRGRGSISAPAVIQSGDLIGEFGWAGSTLNGSGVGILAGATKIRSTATQTWGHGAIGSDIRFATVSNNTANPTEKVIITHDGIVGIGTVAPTAGSLHLKSGTGAAGQMVIETTQPRGSGLNYISLRDPSGEKGYIGYGTSANDGFRVWNSMNAAMTFATNAIERLTISSGGSVGVGTSSPSARLHVNSQAANTTPIMALENSSGNVQIFRVDASPNGSVVADRGDIAIDTTFGIAYIKAQGNGDSSGWQQLTTASGSVWSFSAGTTGLTPATASTGVVTLGGVLKVENGGTNKNSWSPGSVVFADGYGTTLTGDSTAFFWDQNNLRLGLGTSSPLGRLDVATGQFLIDSGSTTVPAIASRTQSNTGIYFPGAGVSISTAGIHRVAISAGGNVGIGTSSPSSTLSVAETFGIDGSSGRIVEYENLVPAKGNLLVGNGSALVSVGVGSNNHVLMADSSEAAGVKWAPVTGSSSNSAPIGTQSSDYLMSSANGTVLVNAASGPVTITLPAASASTGLIFTIKKKDITANIVTVDANASELIDGATTYILSTQYEAIKIQSDGTSWWII